MHNGLGWLRLSGEPKRVCVADPEQWDRPAPSATGLKVRHVIAQGAAERSPGFLVPKDHQP